jgi:hypothetical protein
LKFEIENIQLLTIIYSENFLSENGPLLLRKFSVSGNLRFHSNVFILILKRGNLLKVWKVTREPECFVLLTGANIDLDERLIFRL